MANNPKKKVKKQRPWRGIGRRGFRGFVFGQPNRNRFTSRFRQKNGLEIGAGQRPPQKQREIKIML